MDVVAFRQCRMLHFLVRTWTTLASLRGLASMVKGIGCSHSIPVLSGGSMMCPSIQNTLVNFVVFASVYDACDHPEMLPIFFFQRFTVEIP